MTKATTEYDTRLTTKLLSVAAASLFGFLMLLLVAQFYWGFARINLEAKVEANTEKAVQRLSVLLAEEQAAVLQLLEVRIRILDQNICKLKQKANDKSKEEKTETFKRLAQKYTEKEKLESALQKAKVTSRATWLEVKSALEVWQDSLEVTILPEV